MRSRPPTCSARGHVATATLSDIDLIVVAPSRRPFVERFRDSPDLVAAPAGVDLLVYTPAEFDRERRTNRFLRQALRGALRLA